MSSQNTSDELQSSRFKQKALIASRIGDELLLYDQQTSTAHCLNGIAGEMWAACNRESSATEVTEALRSRWPDLEKELVWASLSQMADAGLLDERTDQGTISSRSRRQLIRKLGITAAAVLPIVVTSLSIPPPAAAASCGTLGSLCGAGKPPCCAGLRCVAGLCV